MFSKKNAKYLAGVAVLAFAAYVGFEFYARHEVAEAQREETLEQAIPTVSVVHPRRVDPHQSITLPGNIEAWYQASIYAQVSGYVESWQKDYGAVVHEGDQLAKIRTPTLNAQYEQAKADAAARRAHYELAEVTAHRFAAMRESHAVAEQQIIVKEAEARVARAEYEAAEQNVRNFEALLRWRTIVAPFDGVVTSRRVNVGDYVTKEGNVGSGEGTVGSGEHSGASELFTVADIHKMRLFVSVPESFGQYLRSGLTADVTVPQFPNRHFEAQFLTVANGFGTDTRTAVTEFVLENEDGALWPGSYASVRISVDMSENDHTLEVPATSLVFEERGTELATLTADNKVHFKPIRVSRILDGTIELYEGVTEDDLVIDNPAAGLLEGDEVRVVTPEAGYQIPAGSQLQEPQAPAGSDAQHATPPAPARPAPAGGSAPQPASSSAPSDTDHPS